MSAKSKNGRPSKFSEKLATTICKLLSDGKTLLAICRAPEMPHRETVRRWLHENEEFYGKYVRARTEQAEALVDKIHEIAANEEDVNRGRLRIDAIKWHAAKLKPGTFGDKLTQEISGPGGGAVKVDVDVDLELARRISFVLDKVGRNNEPPK